MFKRFSTYALSAALASSCLTFASAGTAEAANCQRNHIEVKTNGFDSGNKWSVYGDLVAGNGQHVHHWQEEGKDPKNGRVWWEFTYCGDNGRAHVWIKLDPFQELDYLNLELDRSYCWQVNHWPGRSPAFRTVSSCS